LPFPKNIFQVWFQGYENIKDKKFIENIKNWKRLNPDWNYKLLNDTDLEYSCKNYSLNCLQAYKKAKSMHTKIDLGKLVNLYLQGGIMVDMDMYILRSLEYSKYIKNIIKSYEKDGKNIVGLSLANVDKFESYIYIGKPIFYNNAVIISSPKNEFIKLLIDKIIDNIENLEHINISNFEYINKTSGPIIFNNYINQNITNNISEIINIPYNVFEPCRANKSCIITDETISLHVFEMSWLPVYLKSICVFYLDYSHILILLLILIIIYIFYKLFKR